MTNRYAMTFVEGAGDDKFGHCQGLIHFGTPDEIACLEPQFGVVTIKGERFAVCQACYDMLKGVQQEIERRKADGYNAD